LRKDSTRIQSSPTFTKLEETTQGKEEDDGRLATTIQNPFLTHPLPKEKERTRKGNEENSPPHDRLCLSKPL